VIALEAEAPVVWAVIAAAVAAIESAIAKSQVVGPHGDPTPLVEETAATADVQSAPAVLAALPASEAALEAVAAVGAEAVAVVAADGGGNRT
jgi:hypothetical protein